uniref:RNA-binding protein 41 n=1 Tax=Aegilops tauschii TaxID=37682 RepID=N1QRG9_AEGTA
MATKVAVSICIARQGYAYPPPDGNILTNIVNSLIAVPRFYTQVLHLMNKMNLPAPFRTALPTPPLPSQEDVDTRKVKRAKHEAIVGPAVDRSVAHESVGVKPAALVPNELQVIKKKNPVLQIKLVPKAAYKELADRSTIDKGLASRDEQLEEKHFAMPQEIEKEKLSTEEILSLPMFKNYTPGNPASVLYIKNLAKDVVHDDFYYVFGSVFESLDAARSGLSIKLMQEGRMRGQAFVTFPSVELAQRALNLAHGYAFKGKPMIIQFDSEFGVMCFLCPELLISHQSGSSCGCKGLHVVLTALRLRPFEVEDTQDSNDVYDEDVTTVVKCTMPDNTQISNLNWIKGITKGRMTHKVNDKEGKRLT